MFFESLLTASLTQLFILTVFVSSAGPIFQVLKGQPGDLFGIARSSEGKYIVEKNTDEIKALHEFFFPEKSKEKKADAGAAKRRAPSKKKAASATTTATTTEDCADDDTELKADCNLVVTTKRRKIGGSSGLTKRILPNTGTAAAAATSRLNFYQTERLMGPLTRPQHTPMPLLPGEVPLGIETFFGEGNYASLTTLTSEPPPSARQPATASAVPECTAKPPARYRHAVNRAREGMKKKALAKGGKNLVLRAVRAVELFERICLGDVVMKDDGQTRITAADRRAACIEYDAVLREIYPKLILDAHVLDVKILEDMEGTGKQIFFPFFPPTFLLLVHFINFPYSKIHLLLSISNFISFYYSIFVSLQTNCSYCAVWSVVSSSGNRLKVQHFNRCSTILIHSCSHNHNCKLNKDLIAVLKRGSRLLDRL